MKTKILIFIAICILSLKSFSQNGNGTKLYLSTNYVLAPNTELERGILRSSFNNTLNLKIKNGYGISLGHKFRQINWDKKIPLLLFGHESDKLSATTFFIEKDVYADKYNFITVGAGYIGGHISRANKITKKAINDNPGLNLFDFTYDKIYFHKENFSTLGLSVKYGLQFNKYLGLQLSYMQPLKNIEGFGPLEMRFLYGWLGK